ncbi:hypothetical protein MMC10_009845 [Thelotrema lepadinum]|nr:hypothetical protein [Thelotrema lepadinum]
MATEVYLTLYYPQGVIDCLTTGTRSYIGLVDPSTVLKYPHILGDERAMVNLDIEARCLKAIGSHKHVIGYKGRTKDGLLLELAHFGSIAEYLENNNPSIQQRIKWASHATEALVATHQAKVLHRDISVHNLLLDAELDVKLADFQGRLLAPDGKIEVDGLSVENTKSFMPRADSEHADWKTDVFALGSAFYYIMNGHEPYPDLDSDDDEDEIIKRFTSGRFPDLGHPLMNRVTHKCWSGKYDSAEAVLQEFKEAGNSS